VLHARGDTAADERRLVQREVFSDGNAPGFRDHCLFGKTSDLAHVRNILAAAVQAHRAVEHRPAGGHVPVAEVRVARQARYAVAAVRCERQDDVVARLHACYVLTYYFDDRRPFVPQHRGHFHSRMPAHKMQVAPADASRGYSDADLVRFGRIKLDVLQCQWAPHLA
jgi:hypothetical protein